MKRAFLFIIGFVVVLMLSACGTTTYTVALITDSGTVEDGTFNQSTWEGISEYCDEYDISSKYYIPSEKNNDAFLEQVDVAVSNGAKIIFATSSKLETTIYNAQFAYPEVSFVLIDGEPNSGGESPSYETAENTLNVLFEEQDAGFLAGYSLVIEGYRNLGFVGASPIDDVLEYGVGFIAGSYYAATELDVDLIFGDEQYYQFKGGEFRMPLSEKAAVMYQNGVDVIFTAGVTDEEIIKTAEMFNKLVVTSDYNQTTVSGVVANSAYKDVHSVVLSILDSWHDENFVGGRTIIAGIHMDAVTMNFVFNRYVFYDIEDNDKIISKIKSGTLTIPKTYDELASFFADMGEVVTGYPSAEAVKVNFE